MELITWVIPVAGIAAVLFALYLARDVMSRDTGTAEMRDVATRSTRVRSLSSVVSTPRSAFSRLSAPSSSAW